VPPETRSFERTRYWENLPYWKRMLLLNEELFILRYFGHKIERLEPFHRALLNAALYSRRSLILFPAAHGKTTLVGTICPILEMCRNPDIRMTGILKNDEDAEGIGQAIQAELLDNTELIRDFGPFQPVMGSNKPFAITKMSIEARTSRAKEPTLSLFGSGSRSALGKRSDWTFCDDVIHDKNSATPEARHKIKEWFMQGPATQGEKHHARLTVVGTRFDPEDLYGDIREMFGPDGETHLYDIQEFDAIVDSETHETLWPAQHPWISLMERKIEMGTLDFNKRFRNIAVDASRMVFKAEYIEGGYINREKYPGCLDRDYKVGDFQPDWRLYAGFDPAVGKSRSAKFCAHAVIAIGSCLEHERCMWIVSLRRAQMTMPQQVDQIIQAHEDFPLEVSMVEANSYQAGLLESIQQKMGDQGLAYRILPHHTSKQNKPDPEMGVHAMAPWFENGWVHIPQANPESRNQMRILVDELVQYPGRTTDTVMALWFAWRAAQREAPRFRSYNRLTERKSIWRPRSGRKVIRNPAFATPEGD
jgi:hypothetical protein